MSNKLTLKQAQKIVSSHNGKIGGKSRSPKKLAAIALNLKKANEARKNCDK